MIAAVLSLSPPPPLRRCAQLACSCAAVQRAGVLVIELHGHAAASHQSGEARLAVHGEARLAVDGEARLAVRREPSRHVVANC